MFRLLDSGSRLCDGLTRRQWLTIGGLGAFAPTMSHPAAAQTGWRERSFGQAKAVIVIFLTGGPSQLDTWDPKGNAPAEIRGETVPIATAAPGVRVGHWMPKIAACARRICVLRAMSTADNAHSSSGYAMLTGQAHDPLGVENPRPGGPNDAPCLAAIVQALRPQRGYLPTAVTFPERLVNTPNLTWPGQDGGYLGRLADPWLVTCDPSGMR